MLGSASIRRIALVGFPAFSLVLDDGTPDGKVLADLGRDGWFRVFFGRGRRVGLPDGTAWRIAAAGSAHCIVPLVTSKAGKYAVAAPHGKRYFFVNGRDYAYKLTPLSGAGFRKQTWVLLEREVELATFESRSMRATLPVPLAAALLCFTLIKYGIPGQAGLAIPEFRW